MNPAFLRLYADKMSRELGHPVAISEAESEVGRIILSVARTYGRAFRFGSYEAEDIVQEATGFAIECLNKEKYDPSRPLENYLHRHVKNRLHNLKRDRHMRPESPCKCCDPWSPGPNPCPAWHAWNERNSRKLALSRSGPAADTAERPDREAAADHELAREIDEFVDETYPAALRADFMRLKQGVELSASRRAAALAPVLARFGEGEAHAD